MIRFIRLTEQTEKKLRVNRLLFSLATIIWLEIEINDDNYIERAEKNGNKPQ